MKVNGRDAGEGMDLTAVLNKIKPCNTEKPYIFVSYSSKDCDRVWRDVLEFQRRGYNVWLDERNLDKTNASWAEDALPAIEDIDCMLVVFYVSSHSLISPQCYRELSKTVAEETINVHFEPIKFIAVDVHEIGDITEFGRVLQNEIRSSGDEKKKRTEQAIALSRFMKEFFHSNNEKIRIRPKNDRNRRLDYYEDILSAFPEETRIYQSVYEKGEGIPEEGNKDVESIREPQTFLIENIVGQYDQENTEEYAGLNPREVSIERTNKGIEDIELTSSKFQIEDTMLVSYQGSDETVVVPKGITIIGEEAFKDCLFIKKVIIPNGVISIEYSAFSGCKNMNSISLPDSVKQIGKYAFSECNSLQYIDLPSGLGKIAPYTFFGCKALEYVKLPQKLIHIGESAFVWCINLKEMDLPEMLSDIGTHAFSCSGIMNLCIRSNMRRLGEYVFQDCRNLKRVTMPGKIQCIGKAAFRGCVELSDIQFSEALLSIEESAFEKCYGLKEVMLPESLKKLGKKSFCECINVKRVVIPKDVMELPEEVFADCINLEAVILPARIKKIGTGAFQNCNKIENVERMRN